MITKDERRKINKRNKGRSYSTEKAAENLFCSERVGTMGHEDNYNRIFSIETKTSQDPPKSIQSWMDQAIKNCGEGKVPLVYLHKLSQTRDKDWVVMQVGDFRRVFEKLLELSDPRKTLL